MELDAPEENINDDLHFEQRLTKVIMSMPDNVRDRFKLLKVLNDRKTKTVDHIRKLNIKYEKLKAPLYEERNAIISGETYKPDYLVKFDQKHEGLKKTLGKDAEEDDDWAAVKINTDDLVEAHGVPGFWLKALKHHNLIAEYIKKQDEPILKHLVDISGHHYSEKHGYELTFTFSPNEYMEQVEITKTYHMIDDHILEKTESTEITWKEGKDPTKKETKKKQKNKKTGAVRVINKLVDQESFFLFFKSKSMPEGKELDDMEKEDKEELATKIDEDFDLGNDILNEVIPEALELYLGIVDNEFTDLDSDSIEAEGEGDDMDKDGNKSDKDDN